MGVTIKSMRIASCLSECWSYGRGTHWNLAMFIQGHIMSHESQLSDNTPTYVTQPNAWKRNARLIQSRYISRKIAIAILYFSWVLCKTQLTCLFYKASKYLKYSWCHLTALLMQLSYYNFISFLWAYEIWSCWYH